MTASVPEATKKVVEKLTLAKLKTINQEVREALRSMSATRKEYAQLESILSAVKDKLKLKEKLTVENLEEQLSAFFRCCEKRFFKKCCGDYWGIKFKTCSRRGSASSWQDRNCKNQTERIIF